MEHKGYIVSVYSPSRDLTVDDVDLTPEMDKGRASERAQELIARINESHGEPNDWYEKHRGAI